MSRQYKAYASAYQARDHESSLQQGEVQQYACDFNGALNSGETITSANWASGNGAVSLSGLDVEDGVATITVTAVTPFCAWLTLTANTNQSRVLKQGFYVTVTMADNVQASQSWSA